MLDVSWEVFKSYIDAKPVNLQFIDVDNRYHLQAFDGIFRLSCNVFKTSPGNTDQVDFETNYKTTYKKYDLSSLEMHFEKIPFKLASSKEMAIDGSSVNKIFVATSLVSEISYVENIAIIIEDDGNFNLTNFAGNAALTNGIDLKLTAHGEEIIIANIKDNADLLGIFSDHCHFNQVINNTIKVVIWKPSKNMALNPSNNDKIELIIKDNLTGVAKLNAFATLYHIHGGV